ncbi:hypothetical protein FCI23_55040, partial [Actinacidiphila oryziradicis]
MSVPVTVHPLEEYPSLPPAAPPVVTVDGPEFFRHLARVLPAAGKDNTLPVLTMVSLTLSGRSLRMATSDRYRLTVADVPAQPRETDTEAAEPTEAVLVPARVPAQVAQAPGHVHRPDRDRHPRRGTVPAGHLEHRGRRDHHRHLRRRAHQSGQPPAHPAARRRDRQPRRPGEGRSTPT